jgi:hypothetical protein
MPLRVQADCSWWKLTLIEQLTYDSRPPCGGAG